MVRKRKQPSTSTSQPGEGKATTVPEVEANEAAQAKKQKKVEEKEERNWYEGQVSNQKNLKCIGP